MKYQSNILESTPWSISIDLWSDFSKIAKQIMLNDGLKGRIDGVRYRKFFIKKV